MSLEETLNPNEVAAAGNISPGAAKIKITPASSPSVGGEKRKVVRKWTPTEDEMLKQLVASHGAKHWGDICTKLKGRTGKQCRERWHNHLDPNIRKDPWTKEEDDLLMQAHQQVN